MGARQPTVLAGQAEPGRVLAVHAEVPLLVALRAPDLGRRRRGRRNRGTRRRRHGRHALALALALARLAAGALALTLTVALPLALALAAHAALRAGLLRPAALLAGVVGAEAAGAGLGRLGLGGSRGGTLEQDGEPLREIAPGEHVGYASVR